MAADPQPLSAAEQLAVAVLRGDREAALPLCDEVLAAWGGGARPLARTHRLAVEAGRLRLLAFLHPDFNYPDEEGTAAVRRRLTQWLDGSVSGPALLHGIERVELFELPAPPTPDIPGPCQEPGCGRPGTLRIIGFTCDEHTPQEHSP